MKVEAIVREFSHLANSADGGPLSGFPELAMTKDACFRDRQADLFYILSYLFEVCILSVVAPSPRLRFRRQ